MDRLEALISDIETSLAVAKSLKDVKSALELSIALSHLKEARKVLNGYLEKKS